MWPLIITSLPLVLLSTSVVFGRRVPGGSKDELPLDFDQPAHVVSLPIREYWMQQAIHALYDLVSPCPFGAFGTVVVNHTAPSELGDVICIGANGVGQTGDPTLHGEIAGIQNCSAVLTDLNGPYKLSPQEAIAAYKDLTLYTTAEPCPMCASAIRWAGFKECVFGTSIDGLINYGWLQIDLRSSELFERSATLGTSTKLVGGVLTNETNPLFAWQYDGKRACPKGCARDDSSGVCAPSESHEGVKEEL